MEMIKHGFDEKATAVGDVQLGVFFMHENLGARTPMMRVSCGNTTLTVPHGYCAAVGLKHGTLVLLACNEMVIIPSKAELHITR
jgi:hypothetical protein